MKHTLSTYKQSNAIDLKEKNLRNSPEFIKYCVDSIIDKLGWEDIENLYYKYIKE